MAGSYKYAPARLSVAMYSSLANVLYSVNHYFLMGCEYPDYLRTHVQ